MPIDPNGIIESVRAGLADIPTAIIAIALLGGPTLVWLFYRFIFQPRSSRYSQDGGDPFWICANCRSANALRLSSCYRCGFEPAFADEIHVVDDADLAGLNEPPSPYPGIPVGPGQPTGVPADRVAVGPGQDADDAKPGQDDAASEPVAIAPARPAPGRPAPSPPRRAVVADRRTPGAEAPSADEPSADEQDDTVAEA